MIAPNGTFQTVNLNEQGVYAYQELAASSMQQYAMK
jgi:predicted flap endonuclease-1-like 5' DNA nuclease